eukprot:TRINITY_DN4774_c0_g1_i11.p1 TRINITY_DN4774_c0_g1~~TRINITY_DN4774_c0_g1_i11.p1  ORF type:complete len:447 (+),score=38.05 TRINITY_DN4774_c0_g1_i11:28-1341(+)
MLCNLQRSAYRKGSGLWSIQGIQIQKLLFPQVVNICSTTYENEMFEPSISRLQQDKQKDDPIINQINQAKLLSDVEKVIHSNINSYTLQHINACLQRFFRQVISINDSDKRFNVQQWASRMENLLMDRVKEMMPLPNSTAKAQMALLFARHSARWRPTDFVDLILLSICKNIQKVPKQERSSMSIQDISIALLAAAFNKSLIQSSNEILAKEGLNYLQKEVVKVEEVPASTVSALIYSLGMLELKQVGSQIINELEEKGGFMDMDNTDHLSMLLVGLFALDVQLSETSRTQLEKIVVGKLESGKNFTQLQLSHMIAGCGGLRLLGEDQFHSLCQRFQKQAVSIKRAYCLNEVMLGMIQRGYNAQIDAELMAAIHAGCQQFLSPSNRKITQEQQLSLLRGLWTLGMDRISLKSKLLELKISEDLYGDMLSVAQFGRDV